MRSDDRALITGEAGTGKELVARAIHAGSRRCEGAFPGADADREGLVQQARGGTLFLDEVGLLPLPLQTHLLRVLQEGRVRRTGAAPSESLDLRVLAASSEDLQLQVELGQFSAQLCQYLGAARIELPPLRERPEDVELLAQRIAGDAARREGKSAVALTAEALAWLRGQEFPGNNRELRRILEPAVARLAGPLTVDDLRLG